jgi:hypothetical protein
MVPLPNTSPGCSGWSAETAAMTSAKLKIMAPRLPSDHVWPFTRAVIRAAAMSIESAVVMAGPMEVAKSLPNAGPIPTFISWNWMSRALQSLKIVYPAMQLSASSGVTR